MLTRTTASLIALAAVATTGLAGPLAPPAGPIASTGKTLTEVEPRIAVNSSNTPGDANSVYKITLPGSYYLTGNVTGSIAKQAMILIAADGVTLDMCGYRLTGNGSEYGIDGGAIKGATITNGVIVNCNTNGVSLSTSNGTTLRDVRTVNAGESSISAGIASVVERCIATQCGSGGINVLAGSVIRDCVVAGSGDAGISGTKSVFENCAVTGASGYGFSVGENSTVVNCSATSCGYGFGATTHARFSHCGATASNSSGFTSGFDSIVENCTASNNAGDGIDANDGASVRDCIASNNQGHGISADNRCYITANNCRGNGVQNPNTVAGVYLAGSDTRVESNNVTGNDWGIRAVGAGNFIVRNTASGNVVMNYSAFASNVWGPIVSAAITPAFNANSGFGGLGTTDPSANFSY